MNIEVVIVCSEAGALSMPKLYHLLLGSTDQHSALYDHYI